METPCQKLFKNGHWVGIGCPFCPDLAPRYAQLKRKILRVDLSAFIANAGRFREMAIGLPTDFFELADPLICVGCNTKFSVAAISIKRNGAGGILNIAIFGQGNIARPA